MNPALRLSLLCLGLLGIAWLPVLPGRSPNPVPAPSPSHRRALLVGCTTYYHHRHNRLLQLEGPGNDVALFRQVLRSRFGFADADITVLAEQAGEDRKPTRANIEQAVRQLAREAKPGDQIVILLAGHGSQQPDRPPLDEPDGLDETFLPADIGAWDGGRQTVTNAIVDDELHAWTHAILAKGAAVWVVMDACHSGTGLRAGDEGWPREVTPRDLGVPDAVLAAAHRLGEQNAFDLPGLVATYAAQPYESTFEQPLPPDAAHPRRHGRFSYTLCQVLTRSAAPLTYRELVQRVHDQYVQWGWTGPTPLLEGPDQDREVFGDRRWPGRSRLTLGRRADGGWVVNAGRLHGLTEGTILAVFPPPDAPDRDRPLGQVRIHHAGVLEAEVRPVDAGARPLPDQGRCEVVHFDYGSLRIPVAVEVAADASGTARQLADELRRQADRPGALFSLAAGRTRARWVIHFADDGVRLQPTDDAALPLALRPDAAAADLADRLNEIASVQNLLALTNTWEPGERGVAVDCAMNRFLPEDGEEGRRLEWAKDGVVLRHGDSVGWRMTNRGGEPVDVSLLFVDSAYRLFPMFPSKEFGSDNRIPPGQSRFIGRLTVNAKKSAGLEHLVVIAVRAQGPLADFTCLTKRTFREFAQVRGAAPPAFDSPLARLLEYAMFAEGTTRGLDVHVTDQHQLRRISWRVVQPPRVE